MELSQQLREALVGRSAMTERLMGEWQQKRPADYLAHKRAAIARAVRGRQGEQNRGEVLIQSTGIFMHGLDMCPEVLRRWDGLRPGEPLPLDWNDYRRKNQTDAVRIAARDPELVALLSGTASGSLRADALTGKLSSTPPAEGQIDDEARNKRVQEILAAKPWGTTTSPPNITLQMELRHLAPQVADMAAATHARENPQPTAAERHRLEQQMQERDAQIRRESIALATRLSRNNQQF
jgi:hypothetical protein